MNKNYNCIEKNYNRHIKAARAFSKGTEGYERAIKICEYFESVDHPHTNSTFTAVRFSGEPCSDRQFAINLMKDMAYLVAENEFLINDKKGV